MKVYTKTGDKGTTSLVSGRRISKAHARINTYGTVDELNVAVGSLRDEEGTEAHKSVLLEIQDRLFTLGSLLADDPNKPMQGLPQLHESDITFLEESMDTLDKDLPSMRNFVLPGGHVAVSAAHRARVICRRAERLCIELRELEGENAVNGLLVRYLNRLSDYFFVLSRHLTLTLGAEEIPWKPRS